MVDREARREYAELVRQFISGRMTIDEYEERYEAIQHSETDTAFGEIYFQTSLLYDDDETHRMTGAHRLNREGHHFIAKVVLFLQSSEEYRWPLKRWDGGVFLATALLVVLVFALSTETPLILRTEVASLLVFGWARYERERARQREKAGDKEAWPFLRQADLAEATRHPQLLNGKRTMP